MPERPISCISSVYASLIDAMETSVEVDQCRKARISHLLQVVRCRDRDLSRRDGRTPEFRPPELELFLH